MNKRAKIADLVAEILALRKCGKNHDLIGLLCNIIWNLSKGTKQETDCKELIIEICPEYFND